MYYDILTQVKNAQAAKKESLLAPFSRADFAVLKVLAAARYIKDVQKKAIGRKSFLEVKLTYNDGAPRITTVKIVSKPGKRMYVSYSGLKPVRQGYGVGVISTSRGVMSVADAKKQKIGGEYLAQVW